MERKENKVFQGLKEIQDQSDHQDQKDHKDNQEESSKSTAQLDPPVQKAHPAQLVLKVNLVAMETLDLRVLRENRAPLEMPVHKVNKVHQAAVAHRENPVPKVLAITALHQELHQVIRSSVVYDVYFHCLLLLVSIAIPTKIIKS
jgi:hypothetical protein